MSCDSQTKSIRDIWKKEINTMLDNMFSAWTSVEKGKIAVKMYTYLQKTKHIWLECDNWAISEVSTVEDFRGVVLDRLLYFETNNPTEFPNTNTFLVDFKFRCKWVTKRGSQCKKKPYNGVCKIHQKYAKKLKDIITEHSPTIRDLSNIIIEYTLQ